MKCLRILGYCSSCLFVSHHCTLGVRVKIWVRSWRCGCLVTWFCYHLIAKPGNKTAALSWPDPYIDGLVQAVVSALLTHWRYHSLAPNTVNNLVQGCGIYSANALEIPQSCAEPSKSPCCFFRCCCPRLTWRRCPFSRPPPVQDFLSLACCLRGANTLLLGPVFNIKIVFTRYRDLHYKGINTAVTPIKHECD